MRNEITRRAFGFGLGALALAAVLPGRALALTDAAARGRLDGAARCGRG